MMTREYTGKIQKLIDPNFISIVLSSYGIIGFFFRPFADWIAFKFKNRKIILFAAPVIITFTFIPFIIVQNNITSIIQSIGIGVGASMIGTYELLFKEQYTENKSYLTVSVLALPPLLADFLTSPIQSAVLMLPSNENNDKFPMIWIWIIALLFLITTFVMIFFVKENREFVGNIKQGEKVLKSNKYSILWIIIISFLGFLIAFIKFANSGSVAILNLENINQGKYSKVIIDSISGYISLVFSGFQLIGSVLMIYLLRKFKKEKYLFIFGIAFWIIFHIITLFVNDSIFYFIILSINGFSYGLIYNLFLALILSTSFSKAKITPMGIYQGLLSLGIAFSTFFTSFIKENLKIDFKTTNYIVNGTIIGLLIFIILFYLIAEYIKEKYVIFTGKKIKIQVIQ